MEQEASALRSRVQFEQFFSRELAEELRRNPAILEGEERDVTVLFADIRGFSRLAQRVGPRDYYRVAQEILSRLTQRVQDEHGIIVDYTGDGLLAMWNAPFHHLDHASRACRTALAMVTDLDQLVESWKGLPAESLDIGVGVNTGTALVGNTGTPLKMKYGPRGHVVNLGSRLEGATKHLGVRVIISASTRQTIDPSITVRRLGKARLVGIADPVELYELVDANLTEESRRRLTRYETALALFEVGDFGAASLALQEILRESAGDIDLPTFQLLSRVIPLQKNAPADFDSVLRLDTK
jgi:adenylate cyclase